MLKVISIHGIKDKHIEAITSESVCQQSFSKLIEGISKISNCIDKYSLLIKYDSIYKIKIVYNDRDLYTVSTFEKNILIEKKIYNLIRFLKQMSTKNITHIKVKSDNTCISFYP